MYIRNITNLKKVMQSDERLHLHFKSGKDCYINPDDDLEIVSADLKVVRHFERYGKKYTEICIIDANEVERIVLHKGD